jgi:hypothetical protein
MSIRPQLIYEIKHQAWKYFWGCALPRFQHYIQQVGWNIQGHLLFLPSICGLYPNLNKSSHGWWLCQLQPNFKKWKTLLEREFERVFNPIYFHPFPIGKHYCILSRLIVDISKVDTGMPKWYFHWHIDKNSLSLSLSLTHTHTHNNISTLCTCVHNMQPFALSWISHLASRSWWDNVSLFCPNLEVQLLSRMYSSCDPKKMFCFSSCKFV